MTTDSSATTTCNATSQQVDSNIWKRALVMIFFVIIMRVVELVLGVMMLGQFVAKLATGRTIASLTDFGASLSHYVMQIVRFQTFVCEDRPYPFAAWPGAADGGNAPLEAERVTASDNDTPPSATSGTPNPV